MFVWIATWWIFFTKTLWKIDAVDDRSFSCTIISVFDRFINTRMVCQNSVIEFKNIVTEVLGLFPHNHIVSEQNTYHIMDLVIYIFSMTSFSLKVRLLINLRLKINFTHDLHPQYKTPSFLNLSQKWSMQQPTESQGRCSDLHLLWFQILTHWRIW